MNAGRKRSFCKEQALDKAMHVFWENGYAGTSVAHLTEALGINKPSLYAAFGNKEKLFGRAMQHYMEHYASHIQERLTNPPDAPLKDRLLAYLSGIIEVITNCESPKGCMFVKSSCESDSIAVPDEIKASLKDMGLASDQALIELLEAEKLKGQLPEGAQVQVISGYLQSVSCGLTMLAGRGQTQEELTAVAEMSVSMLPEAG